MHILQELAKHLHRSSAALFIGADLPRETTGLPSRADLARDLARRHDLDPSLSLAEVAQRVGRAGNRWDFSAFIRDQLDPTGKSPQPFHQRVVELVREHEIETLISTAYDNLLELAFQGASIGINRVVRGSDVSFATPGRPTLIKLYGDAQQPDTLVVTEDDHYGLWRDRDKQDLLDEVRTALRKNAVLFLGYNLGDPDFNLLWREVLDRAGRFALGAYAVWPGLDQAEVNVWQDRGITILDTAPLAFLANISGTPAAQSPTYPTASDLRRFLDQEFQRLENALQDVGVSVTSQSPLVKRSATSNWGTISRFVKVPHEIQIAFEQVIQARERARGGVTRITSQQLFSARQEINRILEFLHERFPAAGVELPSSSIGGTAQSTTSGHLGAKTSTPTSAKDPIWDTEAIRQLLTAAFSDSELTTLCFDHFRPVYEDFASGMSKGDKIQKLLDYCDRQAQLETLVGLVEARNPAQYARFAPRLRR